MDKDSFAKAGQSRLSILNDMTKKVLITGVNGFLGTALWEYFKNVQPSFTVFGIDRFKPLFSRRIFLCNLNHQRKVSEIIARIRPDTIFHLVGGRVSAEKDLLRNNVLATRSLLEAVIGICDYQPRIIIPGSAAEYGKTIPATKPVKETIPVRPLSYYGFATNMQTELGLMYARAGVNVIIPRIFNVCGYGMPPTLSLGRFSQSIAQIEKGKKRPVIQTRSLEAKRDFLDIKDVCSALFALSQKGNPGEIYNVCSGNSFLMRDLLKKLINYARIDNIVIKENKKGARGIDVSIGSNEKVRKTTGWKPKTDICQSLENTLNYYRGLSTKR